MKKNLQGLRRGFDNLIQIPIGKEIRLRLFEPTVVSFILKIVAISHVDDSCFARLCAQMLKPRRSFEFSVEAISSNSD